MDGLERKMRERAILRLVDDYVYEWYQASRSRLDDRSIKSFMRYTSRCLAAELGIKHSRILRAMFTGLREAIEITRIETALKSPEEAN